MAGFVRLLRQKWNPPALPPPNTSFSGKTILITGGTGGLGLEAAKKIAALHASKLIVTARNEGKGLEAKRTIEQHLAFTHSAITSSVEPVEIVPMTLDMSDFRSIKDFAGLLKKQEHSIDVVILNAGVSSKQYKATVDGWEETLQVNTIGTVLLAVLVLPLLLASTATRSSVTTSRPHLTFVSSGLVRLTTPTKFQPFLTSSTPVKDMSEASSFPTGARGGQIQYSRSKLMLEYAMRHVAALPEVNDTPNGQPKVIVNSLCPGLCASDLGRQYGSGILFKTLAWIFFGLFARTAEQGANAYISAITRDDKSHGKLWKDDQYASGGVMIEVQPGIDFGDTVWEELKEELTKVDESLKPILS